MGTSKSFATPSGGSWTPLKGDISGALNGDGKKEPQQLIAGAINAFCGLAPTGGSTTAGSVGGGGQAARASRRAPVARAVSGLAGFVSAAQSQGFAAALQSIGLDDLVGRPAAEVIAKVSERLADSANQQQQVLIAAALRDAILDAAALQGDTEYKDLEASFQSFLSTAGVEGLIETFLANYTFELVWYGIEDHVDSKAELNSDAEALASAIRNAARFEVRDMISREQARGAFADIDWFGQDGVSRGEAIAADLEAYLLSAGGGV